MPAPERQAVSRYNDKYTEDRVVKILQALRSGNRRHVAHTAAGLSHATFYNWMSQYPEFAERVLEAEVQAEADMIAAVKLAGIGYDARIVKTKTVTRQIGDATVTETETVTTDKKVRHWQAAAWWLERVHPKYYAQFVMDVSKLSEGQLAELLGPETREDEETIRGEDLIEYEDKASPAASRTTEDTD